MDAYGWPSGWAPQNNQPYHYQTCKDWSSPTATYINADAPEDVYVSDPAGSILTNPQVLEQEDQQHFCTHPCGEQACVHHSQNHTRDQAVSQSFAYAADSNVAPAHSYVGAYAAVSFSGGQTDDGNSQVLSPADRDERRRPRSVPPSVRCYIEDRQSHEELACGLGPSNAKQSKARRKKKITLAISNKDLKVQGHQN
ncbi:hypothetical protein PG993_002777 [Apiospora rasikravindrae]|uniref:Uncharacterized protein n=1 Tax=Apiospora rasikravindrae TaxID=990691 RepID=A0ABR1TXP8_9PEZI